MYYIFFIRSSVDGFLVASMFWILSLELEASIFNFLTYVFYVYLHISKKCSLHLSLYSAILDIY